LRRRQIDARTSADQVSRRTLLTSTGLGVAALGLLGAGQTVGWLEPLARIVPRDRAVGPQGLPVNRTAAQAGVATAAIDPAWRLIVRTSTASTSFSRESLLAMPQSRSALPIACVEGWSADGVWDGVALRDLLVAAGASPGSRLRLTSLERDGAYRVTEMPGEYAADPLTLVALALGSRPLHVEHGYPARVIAPGRPGVLQTKWLSSIEVL
jgi:DMSO/TMAO reductase YedYZ molybdopterin-dependent catalytic subunit